MNRRLPCSVIVSKNQIISYSICTAIESSDSTVIFKVIKSSDKNVETIIVGVGHNQNYYGTDYWMVFTSHKHGDFIFRWIGNNKKEADELFAKIKKIKEICELSNNGKKEKKYKKWLFSLCNSPYSSLRWEGFNELNFAHTEEFNELKFVENPDRNVTITKKDHQRFIKALLKIDYPVYEEWELMLMYSNMFKNEVKNYIYNFLERYAFNSEEIEKERNNSGLVMAFLILQRVESNEKVLDILSEYDKDNENKYGYTVSQRKIIIEDYISKIKIIKK
jgi:hypothetical protein